MRSSIAKFCLSRKVVCMLLRDIRYVIHRIFVGMMVSLMTTVLGASCSWTG